MRSYEVIFILDPGLGDDGIEAAITVAKGLLIKEGGEVAEVQKWGKKRLAYSIQKRREGHYVFLRIKAPAKAVVELERHLNIAESVLKFMTVLTQVPRNKVVKARTPAVAAQEAATPGAAVGAPADAAGTRPAGEAVQEA